MDVPSARESSETGKGSGLIRTSVQECGFGSGNLPSEATEGKHFGSTENVSKGSPENRVTECSYNGIEQSDLPGSLNGQASEEKKKVTSENVQNGFAESVRVEINHPGVEQSGLPSAEITKDSTSEQPGPPPEEGRECSPKQSGLLHEDVAVNTGLGQLKGSPNGSADCSLKKLALTPGDPSCCSSKSGGRGRRKKKATKEIDAVRSSVGSTRVFCTRSKEKSKTPELRNLAVHVDDESKTCDKKDLDVAPADAAYMPGKSWGRVRKGKLSRRLVETTRVLRSMSQEKSKEPEPSNNLAEQSDITDKEKRRKKRKKKRVKKTSINEFSRIRMHLRYLLNRMNYEQNLIDAYSGEGWKGQSLEKIKPEKELQRAKSEIFRCKLRIRDLFQRLDSSIAVGRLPESLFDSEGLIDSEDIFCAKCGSKDLPADNDIILCDGACERGFHQFCLQPPLLKEDIPPGNEGWLCPGCDCKIDCIELLNDSQGAKLSLTDNWEKVYPDAAAAGNKLDDSLGLPSDDSEDNDYDPDKREVDEAEGDESSSDESDLYSSEDYGDSMGKRQNLDISSDDYEDDDYDPNAPDPDEQVKQESSSSDFTSDSEDFTVAFDDETMPDKFTPAPLGHSNPCQGSEGERSMVGRGRKQSLKDELSSLLESGPNQEESAPLSGKRHGERLDYKKLHDETYGNDSSDSSDEDFTDAASKKRRTNNKQNVALESPSGKMKHPNEGNRHAHKGMAPKKLDDEGTNSSRAKSCKGSSGPDSSTKRPDYKRLGAAVTQELVQSFKENQYPDRATKENLAKELGISAHQVSKWFENARWSFRHTSRMESKLAGCTPNKGTPPQMKVDAICNGVNHNGPNKANASASRGHSLIEENSRQKSTTSSGRKRKNQLNNQALAHNSSVQETKVQSEPVDTMKVQEVRKRGRPRKNKSAT